MTLLSLFLFNVSDIRSSSYWSKHNCLATCQISKIKKSSKKKKRYIFFIKTPDLKRDNWKDSISASNWERFGANKKQSRLSIENVLFVHLFLIFLRILSMDHLTDSMRRKIFWYFLIFPEHPDLGSTECLLIDKSIFMILSHFVKRSDSHMY